MKLQDAFIQALKKHHCSHPASLHALKKVYIAHTYKKRYYHNLKHLSQILSELEVTKSMISNWDAIILAIAYHDIIYSAISKNNEAKSAATASKQLNRLNINKALIDLTCEHIIATKSHEAQTNTDINYFLDADMSILGADWCSYEQYYKGVRKEFKIYPDFIYNKGRIKVLQGFLQDNIYHTAYFYNKYEQQAKLNIQREISILSKLQWEPAKLIPIVIYNSKLNLCVYCSLSFLLV